MNFPAGDNPSSPVLHGHPPIDLETNKSRIGSPAGFIPTTDQPFFNVQGEPVRSELVQPEFESPEFFAGRELLTVEEDARRGVFSGEIIERNRQKVQEIGRALAEGISIRRIARAFSVSPHTVLGIRDRHPGLIAAEKKDLSKQIGQILRMSAEQYQEALVSGSIRADQIPVGFGIFFDKKSLLDGEPSSRIEYTTRRELDPADLQRALESLKRASVVVNPPVDTLVEDAPSSPSYESQSCDNDP